MDGGVFFGSKKKSELFWWGSVFLALCDASRRGMLIPSVRLDEMPMDIRMNIMLCQFRFMMSNKKNETQMDSIMFAMGYYFVCSMCVYGLGNMFFGGSYNFRGRHMH